MRELPEEWWRLTDEELRDCEIPAQPECVECGGECCAPGQLWAEVPEDTTLSNMRARIEAQGYPVDQMHGVAPIGGHMMAAFECLGYGGPCTVDPKPRLCRVFPVPYLRGDLPEQARSAVRALCPLLRRLEAERAEALAGNDRGPER